MRFWMGMVIVACCAAHLFGHQVAGWVVVGGAMMLSDLFRGLNLTDEEKEHIVLRRVQAKRLQAIMEEDDV